MLVKERTQGKYELPPLTYAQWRIFETGPNHNWAVPFRFRCLVSGRRYGKTFLGVEESAASAVKFPGSEVWYIGPTYKWVKRFAWRVFKEMIPPSMLIKRPSETELVFDWVNGSVTRLIGADNPESLKGSGLKGAVMDEFASMKPEVWEEAVLPMLGYDKGWALFLGTPRGYNHFYDAYQKGQSEEEEDWISWQIPTIQGGLIPKEEIDLHKRIMTDRQWRQEYLATFEAMGGKCYYNFDRRVHVVSTEDLYGDLLIGMDFNVNPMCCVLAIKAAGECHIIDEITIPDSNTQEMCDRIQVKYGRRPLNEREVSAQEKFSHIEGVVDSQPRAITVYPDPTCRARKTSAPAGVTDLSIISGAGFDVNCPYSTYPVKDRHNAVNTLLRSADGVVRLYVDPKCKNLIKSLDGMLKDETPEELSHMAAALGYLIMGEFLPFGPQHAVERLSI